MAVTLAEMVGSAGADVTVPGAADPAERLFSEAVGRVVVESGETDEVFPGVIVGREGQRNRVIADPEIAGGRVFVFVEDGWTERSYEIVAGPDEGLDAHR